MALRRKAGTDTPLKPVEPVTFCRASPLVTEWVGADAVRADGVVRVVRERVFDRRLVDECQTVQSACRMCRRGAGAEPSDDCDGRNRDQCTTSKILHVEPFSVSSRQSEAENGTGRTRIGSSQLVRSVDAMISSLRPQVTSVGGLWAAQVFMQSRVPLVVRYAEPPVDYVVDRGPEYRSQDRRDQVDP